MAECIVLDDWSTLVSKLPTLFGETVDDFVNRQSIAKDISVQRFIKSYIYNVQGTVGGRYRPNTMYYQQPVANVRSDLVYVCMCNLTGL
jgi:hypothetical protein